MPHALFLGSKLGTIQRTEDATQEQEKLDDKASVELAVLSTPALPQSSRVRSPTGISLHMPQPTPMPAFPFPDEEKDKVIRSEQFIRTHLHHAQLDIASSLFCFALVVNSAILIMASAAFYYGTGSGQEANGDLAGVQEGNLFSAHALIKSRVGEGESPLKCECHGG